MSLHPNEVLLAPVVSEKSYAQIEASNTYSFRIHPDAHKTQVRQAVEELFNVKVLRVNVSMVQSKPKRRGLYRGRKPGWKKAIVQLQARRLDRDLRGSARLMPVRRYKPTSPGRRFMTVSTFEEVTKSKPEKALTEKLHEEGRPQQQRPHHDAPSGRRSQAPLPRDRLQAPQGRRARQGRRDRVRPEPLRAHRAAPLRRRREELHPRSGATAGRRDGRVGGPQPTSSRATRFRSRTSRPARSCTTSS